MNEMWRQMITFNQLCSYCPDQLVYLSLYYSTTRVTVVLYSPGVTASGLQPQEEDQYSPRWASGGVLYILNIDGTLKNLSSEQVWHNMIFCIQCIVVVLSMYVSQKTNLADCPHKPHFLHSPVAWRSVVHFLLLTTTYMHCFLSDRHETLTYPYVVILSSSGPGHSRTALENSISNLHRPGPGAWSYNCNVSTTHPPTTRKLFWAE